VEEELRILLMECLIEFKASDGLMITSKTGSKWTLDHGDIIKQVKKALENY